MFPLHQGWPSFSLRLEHVEAHLVPLVRPFVQQGEAALVARGVADVEGGASVLPL